MNDKIPLSVPAMSGNEWKYVKKCLDTGWVSGSGGYVTMFEERLRRHAGSRYAVACINGTAGLFIALKVLEIGRGDEILVPTMTFIAPVNAVRYSGAEPVFMDCDGHLNINTEKMRLFCEEECSLTKAGLKNKKSGKIVKAIMPVHVFGNPCDMEDVMDIAKKYGLKVIEDAAESLGSSYTKGAYKGRETGAIGDIGIYSFNGNKIVTAGGGGMIVTNKRELSEKARYLINQAKDDPVRYLHDEIGYNYRLSNLQAALGVAQIEKLPEFIRAKKRNYGLYKERLSGIRGIELMGIPEGTKPNHWFYSLIVDKSGYGMDREALMEALGRAGIQTRPVWHLNHMQKPYLKNRAYRIENALWFWKRILNIPCGSGLTAGEIGNVVSNIRRLGRDHI